MIEIRGTIVEVSKGIELNSIKVVNNKAKSTIKFTPAQVDIEQFEVGKDVTIVIETDDTLFSRGGSEVKATLTKGTFPVE